MYKSLIASILAPSVVDRGFEFRSGQTKDYKIGMCCFSAKHTALRKQGKENVSDWGRHVYPRTVVSMS